MRGTASRSSPNRAAPVWRRAELGRGLRIEVGDVLAGISVALVLVPQSLAYAELAGMPPIRGLYAAALPPLIAAFFASSPYLQTGPVAVTSLLSFGALAPLASPGSAEYVQLGLLLALVVGVLRLAIGLLRGGFLAYLMSHPVLLGFVSGAAVLIVASQLPTATGVRPPAEGGILADAAFALGHAGTWRLETLGLALGALALVLVPRKVHPLFPGVLVAVVLASVYSSTLDYGAATVGAVPEGLPPFTTSLPLESLPSLLVPGAVIALVGFAEPASIARTFATLERKRWDPDREFASQGIANVTAGLFGGFPVGGSFSRSSLNRLAGARTRWSGAVTGAAVLAFLPFAGLVSPLPKAVLAAIVIGAVLRLIRLRPIIRLAQYSKAQFVVASATFGLTLALAPHVERAVVIGVGLSVALHLWRELSLEIPSWTDGDDLHLRPRGVLWFGSAARLEDSFFRVAGDHPEAKRVVIHLDGLGRIDMTGALALRALIQEARDAGLAVDVLDVRPRWRALVERVIAQEKDPLGGAGTR